MMKILFPKLYLSFLIMGGVLVAYLLYSVSFSDSPEAWQIGFQDSASPIMQGIIELHHDLVFFLLIVLGFVF
jgi:cytochrome c oxidase subunit 2